ncbi:hypothetical protein Ddye_012798 [Dipteronia dyeriana]|uniref:Reverse transcriptase zinc-binding domain-containing protein n=1 Tax=Dipteronia dyeriana TaxID=168575 RepID=A0AAD9X593_9ROSI|nr:hypothetical protein Ddye_012798 [Dipteronia dyeriana]
MGCSSQACMEPPPFGSLKDDEVISTCNTENEPSLCPTYLPNHDQCQDLSMEGVVDTSNKFATLVEDSDSRNDQCNDVDPPSMASPDQCNDHCTDVDSSTTASPDHSLWQSKIKNIDGVIIKGLSSPTVSSNEKKKKKQTAKKGKVNSSQAKTRVRINKITLVANSVFKDWDMTDNYSSHGLGRIWVSWDPRILNITKISETDQIIHCNACILDTNDQFRIFFVYGSNDDRLRKALWQSMCSSQHGSPWIVLGDFNVSRSLGESIGGCSRISGAMEEFNDCLQASEFDDLRFSGLLANQDKSNIFTSGLSSTTNEQLINLFGYTVGSLPIRYLGIPIISTKLCLQDCSPLVDKVSGRLTSWMNHILSYADRLQLIISVLSSLQVFWASYVCLPIKILKIIEHKFCSFLWKGVKDDSKGGGLGIKDLSSWNKALMIRHLWILIYGMNNLWSSWIKAYHLKGSNLWEVKAPSTCSWNLRKLLYLRPIARPLFKHYIGNGSSTSLWFDNWHPDASSALASLRAPHPLVPWFKLVWFPQNIPRMSFILWMAVRGRLPTRDRIHKYDPRAVTTCVLCNSHLESHAHLFFECLFSRAIWTQLMNYYGTHWIGLCWNDFIAWASTHWRGNTPVIVAKKLCLGAAIYHIWRECNCHIFEGTKQTSLVVARSIIDTIRCRLSSINLKDHPLIALNWNVNAN